MKDEVVKVDSELMKEVEKLIEKEKYVYNSKKQVVNLALIEFLNKKKLNKKGEKR
jgi:metal-responsive CopG/Arc/MetJ family transcriptional regulator